MSPTDAVSAVTGSEFLSVLPGTELSVTGASQSPTFARATPSKRIAVTS